MAENESVQLRKEINKLNQLLDIVLLRNAQLEKQLYLYAQSNTVPENLRNAYTAGEDMAENVRCPYPHSETGVNNVLYSIHQPETGVTIPFHANDNLKIGVNFSIYAYDNTKNGVPNPFPAIPQTEIGVNKNQDATGNVAKAAINTGNPLAGEAKAANIVSYPPVPGDTNPTKRGTGNVSIAAMATTPPALPAQPADKEKKVNHSTLMDKLLLMIPKANYGSMDTTATILMRLQQSPKQSIKDLRLLTGLSEDGMVKRIMSMKKYGLVVRVTGIGLVLTDKAIKLLEASKL